MITYWHIIRQNRLWRHNRNTNRSPWCCDNTHLKPTSVATMNACNICGKILQHRSRLSWHKPMHHKARRNSCGNCTKQYRRKEDLAKNMPINTTGFPQPPMTRSRWRDLPSTRQRDPPHRTLSCRYTTPGSKTWVNRTNKVRNFHLIVIIMNDGYVLRQFDVITEKVTQVPTQNTIYWIQKQQNTIHCFI